MATEDIQAEGNGHTADYVEVEEDVFDVRDSAVWRRSDGLMEMYLSNSDYDFFFLLDVDMRNQLIDQLLDPVGGRRGR